MKHLNITVLAFIMAFCSLMTSCRKESQNIFNMFDVTLQLHSTNPKAASEYMNVNPGDSVYIDFTINSPRKDMYAIMLLDVKGKNPKKAFVITDEGQRRSFSGIIPMVADQGVGETTYRIWAVDKEGVYLGDGYKKITINVLSDMMHIPNRYLYYPDSVGMESNSYLSLSKGTTYSYKTGSANAADIDLGIYRKPLYSPTTGELLGYTSNLYSLSASTLPFTVYDISSWTKRGTLFSPLVNGSATIFTKTLTSGKAIETEAKKNTINLKEINGIGSNKFIYFLTPEGKYGVLMINALTFDYKGIPYVNVSVKMQK